MEGPDFDWNLESLGRCLQEKNKTHRSGDVSDHTGSPKLRSFVILVGGSD